MILFLKAEADEMLQLQALTAHRRNPPEPALDLNLLKHVASFLPPRLYAEALGAHAAADAMRWRLLDYYGQG